MTEQIETTGKTVCRIDGSLPLAGRQLELVGKGLPACSCERCRFEAGEKVDEMDDATLETLLELAKQAGRHAEALSLLEELARRHGPETAKGAEALYWRSVVTGWDDRWGGKFKQSAFVVLLVWCSRPFF